MNVNNENINDNEIENDSLKDKIGCILPIVWFVGSLLVMISSKKYSMIALGQYFLVFGIFAIIKSKYIKYKLLSSLFVEIGCGIIVVSILYLLNVDFNWEIVIPILIFIGVILVGVILVLSTVLEIFGLRKVCTVPVMATIVGYDYVYANSEYSIRKKVYTPVYRFNYNNKNYETKFPYYNNFGKFGSLNSVEEIRINPNDPNEILTNNITPKFMIILFSIVTLIFIIAFIYYCIYVI